MAYVLTKRAKRDVYAIWEYIAGDNEAAADRFMDALVKRFELLGKTPFIGRVRKDLRADYRSFPVGRYLIIYRTDGLDVYIMHVLHTSRDLESYPFES